MLVTGATGFIGGRLVEALGHAGAVVDVVARRKPEVAIAGGGKFHAVDLANMDACRTLVRNVRPDHVFHLASTVTGRQELQHVLTTFNGNLVATVNLFTAIAELAWPKSVVVAGSSEEPRAFSISIFVRRQITPLRQRTSSGETRKWPRRCASNESV